jgi:hypothetical protein
MSDRYRIIHQSVSSHCCFEASVVDSQRSDFGTQEEPYQSYVKLYGFDFAQVCESFSLADAALICHALNAAEDARNASTTDHGRLSA